MVVEDRDRDMEGGREGGRDKSGGMRRCENETSVLRSSYIMLVTHNMTSFAAGAPL